VWPDKLKFKKLEKTTMKYYAVGFIPLCVLYILFELFNIGYFNLLFFIVSYCWNFTLRSPGIEQRAASPAYKFSFIKFICFYDRFLTKFEICHKNNIIRLVSRSLAPFSFTLCIFIAAAEGNLIFSFLGSALFEFFYAFAIKKKFL